MISEEYSCDEQMDIYEYMHIVEKKADYEEFSKYMNKPVEDEDEQTET